VNVVSPGIVVTPGYKNELGLSDEQITEFVAQAASNTPLGRAGSPDEIARAVVFLGRTLCRRRCRSDLAVSSHPMTIELY
jgi:NAD(P)-dependent dehydrogenase (short-subunit alcohol dehydrogenase family)